MLRRMKYVTTGLLLLLVLSGCSTAGRFGSENYIVDLRWQRFCIEGGSECRSFSLIGPSYREQWIADAFGMPEQYYSWTGDELVALILNPPDGSYQPEPIGGKRYRVPPTFATHVVWDVLAMEYYLLYRNDNGSQAVQEPWPQPRRFSVPQ